MPNHIFLYSMILLFEYISCIEDLYKRLLLYIDCIVVRYQSKKYIDFHLPPSLCRRHPINGFFSCSTSTYYCTPKERI